MPRFRRRWGSLLVVATIVLFFIVSPKKVVPNAPTQLTTTTTICAPPGQPYEPPKNGGFRWRDVPVNYPVKSLERMPFLGEDPMPRVQYSFLKSSSRTEAIRKERQAAVKKTFQKAWKSYAAHAWKKYELTPISGGSKNTFGGWGATLVDNLDTLLIMDMHEEFEQALEAVMEIDFSPESASKGIINMFEVTIRYLGGLIAAYDLKECKDQRLLEIAVRLGDMIYTSYDTPNRMPITRWSPRKAARGKKQFAAQNGILAEMSSSSLEFTRLSQLTGDMRWYDASARVIKQMEDQVSKTKLEGLWPVGINVAAPDLTPGSTFTFGSMADSAYEYLCKTYQLLGATSSTSMGNRYRKLYEMAMEAGIKHLLFRPKVPDNADILVATTVQANSPSSARRDNSGEHLACFVGGMYALGGRLTSNEKHVEIGRKLTDGCIWLYKNSPNGVMPEKFSLFSCPSPTECKWDRGDKDFFVGVNDRRYLLRPETIESVFYLYRITGDPSLQEAAWDMFQAITNYTTTEYANAALKDVMEEDPPKEDSMESFWMAETLKYFYLIFSEPELISLDDFVFNTEAHPFRVPK